MKKSANTIRACHFRKRNGQYVLNLKACYCWHIPKALRRSRIKPGDLVIVRAHDHREVMLVMEVFREEIEETNCTYKPVLCKLKKNFLKKAIKAARRDSNGIREDLRVVDKSANTKYK